MFRSEFLNIQLKAMQNIIGPYFSKLKWLNYIYDYSKKRKEEVSITLMRIEFWGTPP